MMHQFQSYYCMVLHYRNIQLIHQMPYRLFLLQDLLEELQEEPQVVLLEEQQVAQQVDLLVGLLVAQQALVGLLVAQQAQVDLQVGPQAQVDLQVAQLV
jgi:hypothetical protein